MFFIPAVVSAIGGTVATASSSIASSQTGLKFQSSSNNTNNTSQTKK